MKRLVLRSTIIFSLLFTMLACSVDVDEPEILTQQKELNIKELARQWTTSGLDIETMDNIIEQYKSLSVEELKIFINAQDSDASFKQEQLNLLETSMSEFKRPYNQLKYDELNFITKLEASSAKRVNCQSNTHAFDLNADFNFLLGSPQMIPADPDYNERAKNILDNNPKKQCNLTEIHYTNTIVNVLIPVTAAAIDFTQYYTSLNKTFVVRIDPDDSTSVYVAAEKSAFKTFFASRTFQNHFAGIAYDR